MTTLFNNFSARQRRAVSSTTPGHAQADWLRVSVSVYMFLAACKLQLRAFLILTGEHDLLHVGSITEILDMNESSISVHVVYSRSTLRVNAYGAE